MSSPLLTATVSQRLQSSEMAPGYPSGQPPPEHRACWLPTACPRGSLLCECFLQVETQWCLDQGRKSRDIYIEHLPGATKCSELVQQYPYPLPREEESSPTNKRTSCYKSWKLKIPRNKEILNVSPLHKYGERFINPKCFTGQILWPLSNVHYQYSFHVVFVKSVNCGPQCSVVPSVSVTRSYLPYLHIMRPSLPSWPQSSP